MGEYAMQEEPYVRSEGSSASDPLPPGATGASAPGAAGGVTVGAGVESVPSDQLWRAAVLAAREAAAAAAELRRAFDETAARRSLPPIDGGVPVSVSVPATAHGPPSASLAL